MQRRSVLLVCGVVASLSSAAAQDRFAKLDLESRFLPTNRTIRIYLPPSYHQSPQRRYPVLYIHDGQNVFTSAGTNVAFGWGNWALDRTVDSLCASQKMQEILLVAIDNSPARYTEYGGRHSTGDKPAPTPFEKYSRFLIEELKPKIDSQFRTRTNASTTALLGSSMGGLASLAIAWDRPDVFGGAASLSGAFQVEQTNFLTAVLQPYRGSPKPFRVYLDSGVADFTGGDDGKVVTAAVATELRRIGWEKTLAHYVDARPLTLPELETTDLRRDKWPEAQTSQHNEFYWRLRVWRALTFLFPFEAS